MEIPVTWRCTAEGCDFALTVPYERGQPLWEPTNQRGLYLLYWVRDHEGEHLFCRAHYDMWETVHKPNWVAQSHTQLPAG